MTKMRLFHTPTSPFALKVRIAIRERGLTDMVEEIVATVRVPENEVLYHNPTGKVPALVVDEGPDAGLVLVESTLICEYLDQIGDAPPFLPPEGRARWDERALDAYAHALMDSLAWRTREFRKPEADQYGPFIAYEHGRAMRCFAELEGQVDELEQAEVSLSRILLALCLYYQSWRFPDQDWRTTSPRLAAWYERMVARPSFKDTAPV
jgi:glutathione S-transferase